MLAPVAIGTEDNRAERVSLDFDSVYAEHFDFVWRNLRRLGVPESTLRDASQEVFLVVYRRIGEFVPHGSVRSWLYSILRRVALAQQRKDRDRFPQGAEEAEDLTDEVQPNPESSALRGQSLRLLLELLNGLDDDKRDALIIIDLEGLSVPEACLALDINPNTLYSRLRAARVQMRQRLMRSNSSDRRHS